MASQSISEFPALAAGQVASDDLLPIVDVSDLSSLTGTTKKVTVDAFLGQSLPSGLAVGETLAEYLANGRVFNVKDDYGPGGAVGNLVADDAAAVQAAADAAATYAQSGAGGAAPILLLPWAIGYGCSTPITIAANVSVVMDAPLVKTYTANDTFLTIGGNGSLAGSSFFRPYKLDVRRATQSDWSSESDIGVKFYNAIGCQIEIVTAQNFTIGVQGLGDGLGYAAGWTYNYVVLGYFGNCRYSLDLASVNSGFVNQNEYHSGRAHIDSNVDALHPATERVGCRIRSIDGSYTGNNANTFYSPSWELGATTGIGLWVQHGDQNHVVNGRAEILLTSLRTTNASGNNSFTCAYNDSSAGLLDDQSTVGGNYVIPSLAGEQERMQRSIFQLDDILDNYAPENASNINVNNCSFLTGAGPVKSINGITVGATYLAIPSASPLGVVLDTSVNKEFVIYMTGANTAFRAVIQCYDSGGAILTSAAPTYPNVKGIIASAPYLYSASFGGSYATQTDALGPFYLKFNDAVKTAWVGVSGGTGGSAQLQGFSIYTTPEGRAPHVVPGHTGSPYPTVTQSPQTSGVGTWKTGKYLQLDNPSVNGVYAYLCAVAGSPGTWYALAGVLDAVGSNRGDNDVVLLSAEFETQIFASTLTANRTVTLPTASLYNGKKFRIVRTGLGAFTLTVQTATPTTLKVIPSATAAFVDVEYNGTSWLLTAYGAL